MAKATIAGERHNSSEDAEKIQVMVESKKFDALFVEGREWIILDKSVKSSRFSYPFFVIGFAEWLTYSSITYASKKNVRATAEKLGIPINTTIDAPLPVIFNWKGVWKRRIFLPFLLFFGYVTLFAACLLFRFFGMVLFIVLPIFYFLWFTRNSKRNEFMANSIVNDINSKNFKNVLVSCGEEHVDGLAKYIRQASIDVEILYLRHSTSEN